MSIAMATAEPSPQEQASERTNQAFVRLAEPLRRELKLHCYRMLGSLHEAEDALQETYLRAWRSFDSFDGRGSFRAWLYRIATNVCLDALASRKHVQRLLPDQRAPATAEMPDGTPATDVAWLDPYPDSDLEGIADDAPNPETRYTSRQAVQLAFVAVIQQLPPRQRAVLLLCDVLGWSAAEAATLLGGSTASVNSALQRSRETLATLPPWPTAGRTPAEPSTARVAWPLFAGLGRARSGQFCVPPERGRHVHHAAFAAMVWWARGDPYLLWVGLEALWRLSFGADGSQPAACFRCLFPHRGGRALGSALHPRYFA
jgi:RNA polymerase sigma-70 factor, ECF subfamily